MTIQGANLSNIVKKISVILIGSALVFSLLFSSLPGYLIYGLIFLILLAVAAVFIRSALRKKNAVVEYEDLLKMTSHDKALAERLIRAEMSRSPDQKRSQSIRRARDKLYYDRARRY